MIYRLRLEIAAKETQLYELEQETLEEVLIKGPLEDPAFECHAECVFEHGRLVHHLKVYKRPRQAAAAHGHDLVALQHRMALFCYALVGWSAALGFA